MVDTKALRELCERATAANRFEPMSVRHYFTQSEFEYFRALRNAAPAILDEISALRERLRAAEEVVRALNDLVNESRTLLCESNGVTDPWDNGKRGKAFRGCSGHPGYHKVIRDFQGPWEAAIAALGGDPKQMAVTVDFAAWINSLDPFAAFDAEGKK